MQDFLTNHRTAVDVRILFEQDDWLAYRSDLESVEPGITHDTLPPGSWPVVVATALMGGVWVHEWLYLGHLRDYFQSLLTIPTEGTSLKAIAQRVREHATPPAQPTVLQQPTVPERPVTIRLDVGDD